MNKFTILLFTLLFTTVSFSQEVKAYKIYNSKGKEVSYRKMIKKLNKKDIVLFGEFHNNPISHWLEYEVTVSLDKKNDLILGAEMFEADNQKPLTQYLNGEVTAKGLDTLARLWKNYKTDYKPLVDYAKDNKIKFIATNIPRRFANKVYKQGFGVLDTMTDLQKSWMAPLPMKYDSTLKTYVDIKKMMGDHGSSTLVMAQSTKDATMAHFILKNYKKDSLFIHYNGAFHTNYYEGIVWYLKQERIDLEYGTITTVSQKNINKLLEENKGKADFIICVDEDMTTTY